MKKSPSAREKARPAKARSITDACWLDFVTLTSSGGGAVIMRVHPGGMSSGISRAGCAAAMRHPKGAGAHWSGPRVNGDVRTSVSPASHACHKSIMTCQPRSNILRALTRKVCLPQQRRPHAARTMLRIASKDRLPVLQDLFRSESRLPKCSTLNSTRRAPRRLRVRRALPSLTRLTRSGRLLQALRRLLGR